VVGEPPSQAKVVAAGPFRQGEAVERVLVVAQLTGCGLAQRPGEECAAEVT
jgi:hypothetical protein